MKLNELNKHFVLLKIEPWQSYNTNPFSLDSVNSTYNNGPNFPQKRALKDLQLSFFPWDHFRFFFRKYYSAEGALAYTYVLVKELWANVLINHIFILLVQQMIWQLFFACLYSHNLIFHRPSFCSFSFPSSALSIYIF